MSRTGDQQEEKRQRSLRVKLKRYSSGAGRSSRCGYNNHLVFPSPAKYNLPIPTASFLYDLEVLRPANNHGGVRSCPDLWHYLRDYQPVIRSRTVCETFADVNERIATPTSSRWAWEPLALSGTVYRWESLGGLY